MRIGETVYWFNENNRVYKDGRSGPVYEQYFMPIKIVNENEKEFVCDYGVINKRSGLYKIGNSRIKIFTKSEKDDDVYIKENRHRIADSINFLKDAAKMKEIDKILNPPPQT